MREIKFKVWDKEFKRFVIYSPHISIDINGNVYNLQNGEGNDNYELLQYTGLKDKKGKEIYESDIIFGRRGIETVIFFDAGFHPFCNDIDPSFPEESEILGNSYELKEYPEKKEEILKRAAEIEIELREKYKNESRD
jgi:hypothetical protein